MTVPAKAIQSLPDARTSRHRKSDKVWAGMRGRIGREEEGGCTYERSKTPHRCLGRLLEPDGTVPPARRSFAETRSER